MQTKIKDIPKEERPRERLIEKGASSLSAMELLAILIRTGNKQENALQLTQQMLKNTSLKKISKMSISQLKQIHGIGTAKACQIKACFELNKRLKTKKEKIIKINSPTDAIKQATELINCEKEVSKTLYLNSKKHLIKKETISIGSHNALIIHPKQVFKTALNENTTAIILLHNHPTGNPSPSKEDIQATRKIQKTGKGLGIQLLDHIIIGKNKYYSMKENNLI